jgi:peptide/nickel transport system permease protein
MGYGLYLLFRSANVVLVLIAVVFVSSIVFNASVEQELITSIDESIRARIRDPTYRALNETQRQELMRIWREEDYTLHGLDQPYWIRVLYRARDVLALNLGKATVMTSPTGSTDVLQIIMEALPWTIMLFTTATIIEILLGLYLGLKAAQRVGGLLDRSVSVFAMFSNSLPMWWFGMLMILALSYGLNLFPSGGKVSIPPPADPFLYAVDVLWHMILPLMTVVFVSFGAWTYITRNIVVGTLQEDFVMAARAKGLPERKVVYGHVLRSASPPIVTMSILSLLGSLGGAIITESVFTWPGMGRLYWIALQAGDVKVLLGLTFITTFLYLVAVVAVDFVYGFLDPRVKVGLAGR